MSTGNEGKFMLSQKCNKYSRVLFFRIVSYFFTALQKSLTRSQCILELHLMQVMSNIKKNKYNIKMLRVTNILRKMQKVSIG